MHAVRAHKLGVACPFTEVLASYIGPHCGAPSTTLLDGAASSRGCQRLARSHCQLEVKRPSHVQISAVGIEEQSPHRAAGHRQLNK